eukprot:TRINITY_DN5195_c0_g1_i2.p1 TRINITY_DN5195_c0_g1~~TRINITY_DN5195_c0_g1_i2.p1  ORF type:complete len:138 (+),score=26.82 TRINITY_DN5195_c0_g1_i2:100-513(+)
MGKNCIVMISRLFSALRVGSRSFTSFKTPHQAAAPKQTDLPSYQKSLIWRSSNLGMLELDLLVGTWAKKNIEGFSLEECRKYEEDVLAIETPDLYKYLVENKLPVEKEPKLAENKYIRVLRDVIHSGRKPDFVGEKI